MIKDIILIITVIFFALNMGASGIAPSFAAAYGAGMVSRRRATILFGIFVILGAVILGKNVAVTLGGSLLPKEAVSFDAALIILVSAAVSLFIANLLRVPQSTSQVTVGAIVGTGLSLNHLNYQTLFVKILPMWILLPVLSYVITLFLYGKIYPPADDNLHLYQKVFANEKKIRVLTKIVSCYVAFAIGSNNVANAVGPLFGAGILGVGIGLAAISPIFGLGGALLGKGNLETAGQEIVPLGLVSSTITAFVTATLLIAASAIGIPQSLVQLNICSIFAVSSLKDGHSNTFNYHITKKTFKVWLVTPVISIVVSYMLAAIFLKG